ncbi:YebC/PmpR family DNA-binding transcriptional regulator [Candidatus Nomurabacteria bacterium]|nr:YebC/PmpR family DNA-binding transcriptional regulator [Candidatus Nomurabacteria bacterium]
MSGHSKWATTKRAKEAKDSKRSSLFTKLSKNITIAARDGQDPDANFKLRMAVDKAKALSMPKDNIERAIKRGGGTGEGDNIESLVYEAYGPEGVAIILEVLTDNKNRTVGNLKHVLSKAGGNLGSSGSVLWMFEMKGQIILKNSSLSEEEELKIIESGAEDIVRDEQIQVLTNKEDLALVRENLAKSNFEIEDSDIIYLAKDKVSVSDEEKLLRLLDALDDDDDVNNIYTNADI